ncbi:MAG: hypothetical protein WC765_06860 [Phycisphaerae bacterium]
MNRMQKIAVFNLVVLGGSSLLTIIAVITLYCFFDWRIASAGLGFMGIMGFSGLSPFIFKKGTEKVTCDERDILINRTAALGGFVSAYVWFCLAGTLFIFLFKSEVLRKLGLPMLICGGGLIVGIVHSIVILVQYGRGGRNE